MKNLLIFAVSAGFVLGGCAVAQTTGAVIAAPIKIAGKTAAITGKSALGVTKLTGKTALGATKLTGQAIAGTGKMAGKTVIGAGKGIYYIGATPVHITNSALDTSNKVLRVTTQSVNLAGKVASVSRDIQAVQLEAELLKYRGAANLLSIFVDAVR